MKKQKLLIGSEVAGFIKQRQSDRVAGMLHKPRLCIIRANNDPVTDVYLKIKQRYALDIGVEVEVYNTSSGEAGSIIKELNSRDDVNGIILQLPIDDISKTEELLQTIDPEKDVDGLRTDSSYDPPTAIAINWLLAAYNIDLNGKNIVVLGQGRLVGGPLTRIFKASNLDVTGLDDKTIEIKSTCFGADILICATGVPGIVTSEMVKEGAVVVDAGTASDSGEIVGDVSSDVRDRQDISITPIKGGVGPLTVAALFENLINTK